MSSSQPAAAAATATTTPKKKKRWFPLESNPALINSYVRKLGYDTSLYEFVDVFSTEDWALDMIAQPVAAVLLLYPLTPKQLENTPQQDQSKGADLPPRDNVWFIKQRIGNACGTIGLLHSILNLPEPLRQMIQQDSWLEAFSDNCPTPLDPIQKAEILEADSNIEKMHDEATSDESNATDRGSTKDEVLTHFVSLVCVGDRLYELDGRKKGPVDHGPTTQATLLKDAIAVVQQFMARDPTEMRFTMTALAPK